MSSSSTRHRASRNNTTTSSSSSSSSKKKKGVISNHSSSVIQPQPPHTAQDGDEGDRHTYLLHSLFSFLSPPPSSSSSFSSLFSTLNLCLFLFSFLLRYLVSGADYSGHSRPTMFGDYEAQRHWMEITLHLPLSTWYHNTTDNDLQYWGLDYPPLTAYHSWVCGKIATAIGMGDMVALHSSRGYESYDSKLFMRSTVLVCDLLLFLPFVFLLVNKMNSKAERYVQSIVAYLILITPAFILIDHGHFQYNCVSLGFILISLLFHYQGRDYLGSFFFVSSLCYKQMSLYYAPAYFFYLLARSRQGVGSQPVSLPTTVYRVGVLGVIVILSFLLYFFPFLTSVQSITQVVHRMFPFARGLFEDKVANFWCSSSIILKWRQWFGDRMIQISLLTTILAFLPTCIHVYLRPSRKNFLYTLIISSFSFYLFSFQVHEKSILLPLLPISLLFGQQPLLVTWCNLIGTFSMFPLLEKDGHTITYFTLQLLFGWHALSFAAAHQSRLEEEGESGAYENWARKIVRVVEKQSVWIWRLVTLSIFGMFLLHTLWYLLPPSARYPDLKVMLFVIYSAAHFVCFWIAFNVKQWSEGEKEVEDWNLEKVKLGDMKEKNKKKR